MTLKLSTSWTKGLDEDKLKELRAEVLASPLFRKRLVHIVEERLAKAYKESISKQGLDSPNWAVKQAENCGYLRAMEDIKTLIEKL